VTSVVDRHSELQCIQQLAVCQSSQMKLADEVEAAVYNVQL